MKDFLPDTCKMALVSIFVLVGCCCHMLQAQEQAAKEGEYILMLKEGESPSSIIEQSPAKRRNVNTRLLSERLNIWLLAFDQDAPSENDFLYRFRRMPQVEIAQRNHKVTKRDTTPDDPLFSQKWSLDNNGQNGGISGADISAPKAWDETTGGVTANGDTIVVAVVDGGFDLQHEDLQYWKNDNEVPSNGVDDDNNGYIDDYHGWDAYNQDGSLPSGNHGTHVSGIVGASGDNDTGVTGVNWNVKIMPIAGSSGDEATVVEAYSYALEMRALYEATDGQEGAFVVATNSSFGVDFGDPANHPLWCAFYDSLGDYGILSAGATINSSENIDNIGDVPTACSSPWLISVTNSTPQDQLNSGAGYGPTTIDLASPGTDIHSTVPGDQYSDLTGTSMATPQVAGAIALLYSVDCQGLMDAYQKSPSSVALTIKDILLKSTDTIPTIVGITVSGGRLNVNRAIDSLKNQFCSQCVSASFQKIQPSCANDSNGVIQVNVADSSSQYQIDWSNGNTGQFQSNLAAGDYRVTISDTSDCSQIYFVTLNEPELLTSSIQKQDATSQQTADGQATVTVTGGTSPYSYQWSESGQSGMTANNLTTGDYTVTVTDANGCSLTDSVTINGTGTGIDRSSQNISSHIYPNPANEQLIVELPSSQRTSQLTIIDARGQTMHTFKTNNCENGSSSNLCKKALDISKLSTGLYLLKAQGEKGEFMVDKFLVR